MKTYNTVLTIKKHLALAIKPDVLKKIKKAVKMYGRNVKVKK